MSRSPSSSNGRSPPRTSPHPIRHRLEYAALRALTAFISWWPYRAALGLACGLAAVSHLLCRRARREAYRRIRQVLGTDTTLRTVRRIAWVSWRNLFFNAVEMARFPRLCTPWIARHADFSDLRHLQAGLAEGAGCIVAVPHAGHWDLAGIITRQAGLPIFSIARRQRNPWVDAWLNRQRASTGMPVVMNDAHLLRAVLRRLRDGMLLAILPDVRARTGGIPVPFLNGTAWWGAGAALFARLTGAPIFPAILVREGWTRHRLRVWDPIRPDPRLDKEKDIERMTRALAEVLSRAILEAPEQYFWYNRRWVLEPFGTNPS